MRGFFYVVMLVLVRSVSYTPGSSFSEECVFFIYTPLASFSEEFLLHS